MMIDFMVIPEEVLAVCFDNVSMASNVNWELVMLLLAPKNGIRADTIAPQAVPVLALDFTIIAFHSRLFAFIRGNKQSQVENRE